MIAVVLSRSVAVGIAVNRCLTAYGHEPIVAKDLESALDLLERDDPELVIVDVTSGEDNVRSTIRVLREQATYRYVAVLGTGGPNEVLAAYRAGADEYVRFPFEPTEFGARLMAVERIMRHLRMPNRPEEGPLAVSELPVWLDLENTLTRTLGDTLYVACQRVEEPFPSGRNYVSGLKLALTKPRATVTLYFVVSEAALTSITGLLLGTPTNERGVLVDACKEVLNTLGGSFKRAALPEHDFTASIPKMVSLETMRQSARGAQFRKAWTVGWGKYLAGIQATVACDDVQMVPLHSLTEGMVLADDVRNPLGVLIAPRGTYLTESTIKRLYGVLNAATSLRVSNV